MTSETPPNPTEKSPAKEPVTPSAKPKKAQPQPKGGKAKGSSFGKILKTILILLLLACLCALAFGGYWLYENRQVFDDSFDQDLLEQRELISGLQRGLEREKELRLRQSAQNNEKLATLANGIASQQKYIRELGGTTNTDWLLAEAEFLIRLGHQRLVIERDAANAKSLLESADVILRDLDEVDLMAVRQALAKDITRLSMVEKVDREGLYFQLGAIAEAAQQLTIVPPRSVGTAEIPTTAPAEQDVLKRLWSNFKNALTRLADKAFRLQQHKAAVKPLLAVEHQGVVKTMLALQFEQAQVALMRQEQGIFQQSLQKAQQLLTDYFATDSSAVSLIDQIDQLKVQVIEQPSMDIGYSLNTLKTYIENRHARHEVSQSGGLNE